MFVLLASFHRLQQIDIGVREERVLTFEVNLPTVRYDQKRRASVQELLADRFARIPGGNIRGRHLPSSRHRQLPPVEHTDNLRTAGRYADRP
jgi:hypothetical protein